MIRNFFSTQDTGRYQKCLLFITIPKKQLRNFCTDQKSNYDMGRIYRETYNSCKVQLCYFDSLCIISLLNYICFKLSNDIACGKINKRYGATIIICKKFTIYKFFTCLSKLYVLNLTLC